MLQNSAKFCHAMKFCQILLYYRILPNSAMPQNSTKFCHAIEFCQILPAVLASQWPLLYLLLPLNLTFNLYTQGIYINKCLQCLIQVCLYHHIYQVILAINLLNFKKFSPFIGLLKYYNINYKALFLYSIKLNQALIEGI